MAGIGLAGKQAGVWSAGRVCSREAAVRHPQYTCGEFQLLCEVCDCGQWFLCLSYIVVSILVSLGSRLFAKAPIQITADLTDAPRKLFHAEIDLPVRPGPLALTEAAWIPGHHAQKFVESDITGIVFTANGQTIPWQRDDVDLYQFHLTVPAGVT